MTTFERLPRSIALAASLAQHLTLTTASGWHQSSDSFCQRDGSSGSNAQKPSFAESCKAHQVVALIPAERRIAAFELPTFVHRAAFLKAEETHSGQSSHLSIRAECLVSGFQ